MRLDEFVDGLDRDEGAEKRRLAEEKSYAITEHLDDVERQFAEATSGDRLASRTPEVFVGRSNYPRVSAGVLSPVADADRAERYATGGHWYDEGVSIDEVFRRRTSLLNSARPTDVRSASVADRWDGDGLVGVQREVAIAEGAVGVEIGFDDTPEFDLGVDDVATPTGPRARAEEAALRENPSVPPAVSKVLADDDWNATGAMTYLYRKGLDVYDVNTVLSAGALGETEQRRLVPTRWAITAVDDTIADYLRGRLRNAPAIDETHVWHESFLGNRFWIVATPGQWEFELVEMKAPGSVWNPLDGRPRIAADHEGYAGRTAYADETAGAYYAARLGILEHLESIGRQATVLVLRHVTDDYWGPTGVWVVRETVRNAFDGDPAVAESLRSAVDGIAPRLPVSTDRLRRASELVAGVQSTLGESVA